MTRLERVAKFALRMVGERIDVARSEFQRLFCGPLIGGGYGFGEIEYDHKTGYAKIICDAGVVEIIPYPPFVIDLPETA